MIGIVPWYPYAVHMRAPYHSSTAFLLSGSCIVLGKNTLQPKFYASLAKGG